jgi:hypothetical protein
LRSLATANRGHGVNRLDPGLQRLFHRLTLSHASSLPLDRTRVPGDDRTQTVKRNPQRIHHAAQQSLTNRHRQQFASGTNLVALSDLQVVPENHDADAVLFQIECETTSTVRELNHLARHRSRQTGAAGDTVAHLNHAANFRRLNQTTEIFNLLLDD